MFNERELHSRYEIGLEQYVLTIGVEAKLTLEMGTTVVLPAAVRYQTELATNVGRAEGGRGRGRHGRAARAVTGPITALRAGLADAGGGASATSTGDDAARGRDARRDELLPAMAAVRAAADELEATRRRRPLAAADLPGDALHPLMR